MTTMRARLERLVAWVLLPAVLAGAAAPKPEDREIPPDSHRLSENESGTYAGLGVLIRLRDERLVIQKVFEGSPAEAAGLQRGDIMLSASELDPKGLKPPVVTDLSQVTNLAKAAAVLRGKIGTRVTLGILRGEERLDITVERREIQRPVTEHRVLAGQIGYLRITDFPHTVARQVAAAIAELRHKKVRGLLIDLRGNVGGFLDEAVRVADFFIADGVIVSTRNRNDHEDRVFRASPGGPAEDLPLVVIVDGGSARAAEIVAGSLQDHERARLVGTKTWGKGAFSKRFPLADGSGILLSTGRYHLPKGRQIEGKGLEPDLVVQPPKREDIEKLPPDADVPDPQLDAAAKLLREQLAAGG